MNVYLTGGAVRDMITGFPIRDLIYGAGQCAEAAKDLTAGAVIGDADETTRTLLLTLAASARRDQHGAFGTYEKSGSRRKSLPTMIRTCAAATSRSTRWRCR